jgi:hypothetical protein
MPKIKVHFSVQHVNRTLVVMELFNQAPPKFQYTASFWYPARGGNCTWILEGKELIGKIPWHNLKLSDDNIPIETPMFEFNLHMKRVDNQCVTLGRYQVSDAGHVAGP